MTKKWYYTENKNFINDTINKTFHEIVTMGERPFNSWVGELCEKIIEYWENGNPPRMGFNEAAMIKQVQKLYELDVDRIVEVEDDKFQPNILKTNTQLGNFVNQFFPTMYKTRINDKKSIYDFFHDRGNRKYVRTRCFRHFKKDSFYNYSKIVRMKKGENLTNPEDYLFAADNGIEWIRKFEQSDLRTEWDYWLCPIVVDEKGRKSYNGNSYTEYKDVISLILTEEEVNQYHWLIQAHCIKTAIEDIAAHPKTNYNAFHIRLYNKKTKIFPLGFKSIRMSYSQYATNFPPGVAKFIFEKYGNRTESNHKIIWDFSAGWGGRLAGAASIKDKEIFYIGNDPNTEHTTENGRTKYHELADYILEHNHNKKFSYMIFQECAEDMHKIPEFIKFKGLVDLVFTSPPYFCKEVYSEDKSQSANKFTNYDSWLNGFLYPTLRTAHDWLRTGGYIALNVADIKIQKTTYDLEEKTTKKLEELGFKHVETLRLCLQTMQGANRINLNTQQSTFKHSCVINKTTYKFEPIFVYQKA